MPNRNEPPESASCSPPPPPSDSSPLPGSNEPESLPDQPANGSSPHVSTPAGPIRASLAAVERYMFAVGLIGCIGMILQAWQIYSERSAGDIHFGTAVIALWVCASWLAYGFYVRSRVLIVANVPAVVATAAIVIGKCLYD